MICLYNCQAIHNAEKGEPAALLLSPRIASSMPGAESVCNGGQFTYFLTAPMQAFCQLAGITSDIDIVRSFHVLSWLILRYLSWRSDSFGSLFQDTYANAENILFSALEQYEETLSTSVGLNIVWGQILPDPFLRRLILRYINAYLPFLRRLIRSITCKGILKHELHVHITTHFVGFKNTFTLKIHCLHAN
jgi:hypothetical protein